MRMAPIPSNEELRLEVLRRYEILDTPPEEAFERITTLAKRLFDVPITLISLVDSDRQWFKSCIGLDTRTTSREVSFCAHAILSDDVMIVPDARLDARFVDNPDVVGGPGIRFYAGAPLRTSDGVSLGTLCVIDREERPPLTEDQQATLRDLARVVVDEMELRLALRKAADREVELKRAKAAAEEASAARAQFLSRMSHEFRTPLNAILGFAQLLDGEDLTPDQKEDLRHIRTAGDQLLHLLTEALDLSRLQGGRVRMLIEDVALAPAVATGLRAAGGSAATVEVDPALRVLADSHQLEKVVAELAANAFRHGGEGTTVRAEAERRGETVEVRIVDDGRGMAPDDLERLFGAFERAGERPGLGLGLALAQRTVRAMGGELTADSAPGRGTTMTISLPAGSAQRGDGDDGFRVLYVDDDVSNLRLVEKILRGGPGIALHFATTGAEGVAAALEELPDLVLLDLHLPDVTGAEVVRALRSDPRTARTPILVLTIEDDPGVAATLRELGVAEVLVKPFEADVLTQAIDSLLDTKAVL